MYNFKHVIDLYFIFNTYIHWILHIINLWMKRPKSLECWIIWKQGDKKKLLHSRNWGYNYSLGDDGPKASKSECPLPTCHSSLHIKSKYEPWNFVHFHRYKTKQIKYAIAKGHLNHGHSLTKKMKFITNSKYFTSHYHGILRCVKQWMYCFLNYFRILWFFYLNDDISSSIYHDNYGFLNKASMKLVTMLKVARSP